MHSSTVSSITLKSDACYPYYVFNDKEIKSDVFLEILDINDRKFYAT